MGLEGTDESVRPLLPIVVALSAVPPGAGLVFVPFRPVFVNTVVRPCLGGLVLDGRLGLGLGFAGRWRWT